MEHRKRAAEGELQNLSQDLKESLINYNHYYTDNIQKKRQERLMAQLQQHAPAFRSNHTVEELIEKAVVSWGEAPDANMETFACEEALDCMLAIYKVSTLGPGAMSHSGHASILDLVQR